MPTLELPAYPRLWPFAVGLLALIPLWVAALNLWIRPASLQPGRAEMGNPVILYLIPPVLAVGCLLGAWMGLVSHRRAQARQQHQRAVQEIHRQQEAEEARAARERENHQFTLEVLGLGLSVEMFRQHGAWEAIERSGGAFILPTDPKAYPLGTDEKFSQSSKRSDDAFEHAASYLTEKWLIPGFGASSAIHCLERDDLNFLKRTPDNLRSGTGMAWHSFTTVDYLYDDDPEAFLERIFRFFDENPDAPVAAVYIEDGMNTRDGLRGIGTPPILVDGYRKPTDMTESMVAFVLARRDRLEAIRASALDVPLKAYPFPDDPMPEQIRNANHKPFWEKPRAFRPTRWLPRPWCREQVEQFDSLPLLGRIHRPQTASFLRDGKPLGDKGRLEAFRNAWKQALDTLPGGKEPARVIYDCGPMRHAPRMAPLVRVLRESDSTLDPHGENGVDLTRALGDTGASSFFVGAALGLYASHQHQDVTAVVSFRRADRATLVMIEPPTPDERRQEHPSGQDPLDVPVVPYEK